MGCCINWQHNGHYVSATMASRVLSSGTNRIRHRQLQRSPQLPREYETITRRSVLGHLSRSGCCSHGPTGHIGSKFAILETRSPGVETLCAGLVPLGTTPLRFLRSRMAVESVVRWVCKPTPGTARAWRSTPNSNKSVNGSACPGGTAED